MRYLLGPAKLTGRIVKSAQATLTTTQGWVVNVSLTGTGSKEWDNLASTYFHEIVVIELDGVVQSAPLTLPMPADLHLLRRQRADLGAASPRRAHKTWPSRSTTAPCRCG